MKIPRKLIGRYVEITWMDPTSQRKHIHESPVGRATLGTWKERGVIVDITETDGVTVVKIEHSVSCGPGDTFEKADEHYYSPIPEPLIESCATYTRDPEPEKIAGGSV
jgi:hypothetical protein